MITVNNYTDKANSINWSKLPKALQDTKEDIDFSIELYDDLDKGSKDVIDLFLKQLNKNLSNTEAKKPAAPKPKAKPKAKANTPVKKSNVKSYIVVSTKNGEGYSDPVVKFFHTKEKAVDFLDKEVSDYEKAGFEFVDTKNHITHLSNGEDDASIHILASGKVFNLIEIKPDSNKVKIIHSSDDYISLVEKLKKEVKSKSFDADDVEEFFSDDNDEDYFGSHDEDTGDYIHYDITGGYDKILETKKPVKKYNYKGLKVQVREVKKGNKPYYIVWDIKTNQQFSNEVFKTANSAVKFVEDNKMVLVKSKPAKKKQKASTKKESPCDEAIQNFLEDQKEDREKAAAKRKRNKVKNALDQETVNFYNAEFRLLRRFFNLVSKTTKVSFRSVQLLYMAFQKNAVQRKVRKTSDLASLYNICNKKLTKLYEAIAPEKDDVKITFKDKDVLEQLATLVKNKKVDYSISLINRIINMQGTAPEDAKVKRLISSIDNAIKKGKIDERSRLFDDIKKGKSTLKAYLEDKTEKIPTKQYGLSKPNIQKKKSKKKGLGNPKPKTIEVDLSQVPDPAPKALGNPYTEIQAQPQTEALHLERSKPQSVNTQKEVVKTDAALQNTTSKVIGLKSSKEQRENAKPINYFALNGTIAKFLGSLEKKHKESLSINISGPAGSMKTRFSFQFVDELLTDGLTVGFASLEEHYQSALFRNKEDQYIKPQNLEHFYPFSDLPDTFEQFVAIVNQCDAFFTDSWQKLVEKYGNINYDSQFRKAIDGKILFTIFQETTDGKTRGGSKTTFDGDIILKVDVTPEDYTNNYVYAQKNRYETIPGAKYYIHDKKLVTPQDEAAAQLPQSIEVSLS